MEAIQIMTPSSLGPHESFDLSPGVMSLAVRLHAKTISMDTSETTLGRQLCSFAPMDRTLTEVHSDLRPS